MLQGVGHSRVVKLSLFLAAVCGLCASVASGQVAPFDAASYAAKVITQSGQVSIFKDTQPWALSVGDTVQAKDLIVTGPDGHALLQVSDGSTFEVFPNARVVFRKNPPNWKDFIDVLVGRVRVHIEHLGNVPNPNRVLTPTAVISVRGTTFDISVDDDDETTLVEVEEGTVEVQHALLPRGNSKVLNTGETLKVYRSEPIARNIDKGSIARHVLRSMADAVITVATRMPTSGSAGGIGGAGGGGAAGDTQKVPPPPAAPAPAPVPAPAPPPPTF